ncbi:hypothetical protein [Ferrimicrobium sp.]|uniref:hypothetical protein n=1 Tax=Ferrimicrobium sp. TaxID=2926050 RepID=UPI00260FD845|nr:hypothetical protein [Ferrimicrobium sp.]
MKRKHLSATRARTGWAHRGFAGLLASLLVLSTLVSTLVVVGSGGIAEASSGTTLYASPGSTTTSGCTTQTSACQFSSSVDRGVGVSSGEKSLTIEGLGTGSDSSAATELNGNGGTLTDNASFPVTLDNVTVTGGADIGGGGIYNNGTMTVTDSTISGNSALGGGARSLT